MRFVRPALAMAALTLVGCGGSSADNDAAARPAVSSSAVGGDTPTPAGATGPAGGGASSGAAASSIVPAVDVIEVSTGRSVPLRTTIATDKPTLIWMWAPH